MPKEITGAEVVEFDLPGSREVDPDDVFERDEADAALQGKVQAIMEEAFSWHETYIEPEQAKATDYYMGRPFGNEQEGRSSVVSTDVRDVVQAYMPSLMRIFWGPENKVEFIGEEPEDVAAAEQATDYIDYIIREDNPGFMTIHGAFKDALVRKQGVIKWWWDEDESVEIASFEGLSEQQAALLASDDELEIEVIAKDEETGEMDIRVTRRQDKGIARFEAIPNEEFIHSPSARTLDEARMVAHSREMKASDLLEMDIDFEIVKRKLGTTRRHISRSFRSAARHDDALPAARRADEGQDGLDEDQQKDLTRPVLFTEAYIYMEIPNPEGDDMIEEGDRAGLYLFRLVGDDFEIDSFEPVDERPFALFCPDPEPHTLIGLSIADYVMDIHEIKSNILRGMLDSLNISINQRSEAVQGEVNMQDLMNPEVGGIVRVRKPGMIRDMTPPFVGKEAFPMMQYMDEVKENRTGISKAAAGLDADALQSSTKAAVAATLSGAQQHIEMVARVFAETGMTQLYKGLLRLIVKHQDRKRVIRLRNEYVEIDPRYWNATMDTKVNVAIGGGTDEEKLKALMAIVQEQKELLAQGSPLASNVEYRRALGRFVELMGWANSEEFFKSWSQQDQEQAEQAAQEQPPQPDATMMLVQIEQQKLQLQAQKDQAELELKRQEMMLKDDRERDKNARQAALQERQIEAQYNVNIHDAELKAQIAADRAAMDADIKARQAAQNTGGGSQ
jgi:hypothetical protein